MARRGRPFEHDKARSDDAAERARRAKMADTPPKVEMTEEGLQDVLARLQANLPVIEQIYALGAVLPEERLRAHLSDLQDPAFFKTGDVLRNLDFSQAEGQAPAITKHIDNIAHSVVQYVGLLGNRFPDSAVRLWQQQNDEAGIVRKSGNGFDISLTPAQYMELAVEHNFNAMTKLPGRYDPTWRKMTEGRERGIY